jgi:ATP-binding cassette subfamily B protein
MGFQEVMKGRTTFIIAHRISSLKHADEIIVLDQGNVVQRGTHEQLMKQEGPYLDTYKIQFADKADAILLEETIEQLLVSHHDQQAENQVAAAGQLKSRGYLQ